MNAPANKPKPIEAVARDIKEARITLNAVMAKASNQGVLVNLAQLVSVDDYPVLICKIMKDGKVYEA